MTDGYEEEIWCIIESKMRYFVVEQSDRIYSFNLLLRKEAGKDFKLEKIMLSEKQLRANRENAKKGGVKTAEGKALVRYNAIKHGLLSRVILLPDEDADELADLTSTILSDLRPRGALEKMLAERIVLSIWRLRRAMSIELDVIRAGLERYKSSSQRERTNTSAWRSIASNELGCNGSWININRYEIAIERQLYKALHELLRLRAERGGEHIPIPWNDDVDLSRDNRDGFIA